MAGKAIMKVGEVFHRLTVVELVKDRKNPMAICRCDCGNTIKTQRGSLRNGRAKSCGCARKEAFAAHIEKSKALKITDAERRKRKQESFKKWLSNPDNYAKYRERNRLATRKHHANNPHKARENCRNRRARLLQKMGHVSKGIEQILFARQAGRCACCRVRLDKVNHHLDHIEPLAGDGKHEDSNLQLLCDKCNLSKGAKDPIEFMQSRGYLL